jgi:type III secretory pathway component EscT
MPYSFPSEYHYIRLAISPSNNDALTLRKTLQDALTQTFGVTASSTYIDIFWVADGGEQFVVRVGNGSVLLLAHRNVSEC